jgi:rare lipoprotein A
VFRAPVYAGFTIIVSALAISSGCAHKQPARVATPAATPNAASKKNSQTSAPQTAAAKIGDTETGLASWYGNPYHGRRSASGEIYDMEQLTAAHRTLPFQTWVEVTDLDNGKKVDVRITDRGPFVDGRVIDLSLAAARKIEMVGPGVAKVKLKVIDRPKGAPTDLPSTEVMVAKSPEVKPPVAKPTEVPKVEAPKPQPLVSTPTSVSSFEAASSLYAIQVAAFEDRDQAEAFATSLRTRFPNLIKETRVVLAGPVWRVLLGREMSSDAAKELATKLRDAVSEPLLVRDGQ